MWIGRQRVLQASLSCVLVWLSAGMGRAHAQIVIKAGEDVNFRAGVLGQVQAEWLEDPADVDDTTQNLFVRRIRLLFGGQVAKNVTFFAETDAPNLGKRLPGGKNISPGLVLQDAFGTFQVRDEFHLDGGLMFVPFSRNSIQTAALLLPIDYGPHTFAQSAATESTIGRDAGIQARGYVAKRRIEYRVGVFQGSRDQPSHRSFRYVGRAQYEFLETEGTGFFYTGTYLGTKKVFAVAAAFDTQSDYEAYDVDTFFDHPLGPGAVTAQLAYNRFDGKSTFATLPRQDVVLIEAGYLVRALKLTPVLQFTNRAVADTDSGDERRWSIGVNYWWARHNANIKAAYSRIDPRGLPELKGFTVQLQFFYF